MKCVLMIAAIFAACSNTVANTRPGLITEDGAADAGADGSGAEVGFEAESEAEAESEGSTPDCNDGDPTTTDGWNSLAQRCEHMPYTPEPCDGVDNDGDHGVDEGCPCDPSAAEVNQVWARHCGDSGANNSCFNGWQSCFGVWTECWGATPPPGTAQACTGFGAAEDWDCDGLIGCADPDCARDPACATGTESESEAEAEAESEGEPVCAPGASCSAGDCHCPQVGCLGGVCQTSGVCGYGTDDDHDWYSSTAAAFGCALDCDDTNAAIHPGATESCNGVDDNCDGRIDEGCSGP